MSYSLGAFFTKPPMSLNGNAMEVLANASDSNMKAWSSPASAASCHWNMCPNKHPMCVNRLRSFANLSLNCPSLSRLV